MEMNGKVALVTGGSAGIGAAAAIRLAEAGADVALTGLHEGEIASVAGQIEKLGRRALGLHADVSDPLAMADAFKSVADTFGRLDVLFANAGINGVWAPITEIMPEEWDRTLGINLRGTYLAVHHAVPLLRAQGGGAIVITSSINGTRTFTTPGASAYSASKAAQLALGQMLAVELARDRIRVNVICPGSIKTQINESTIRRHTEEIRFPRTYPEGTVPLTRDSTPADPREVAELVLFLASESSKHITGTAVYVDGGQSLVL